MKAVGSRLERGHDDGSSGAAELSGSHAGLDAKLVNRVSRRKENEGVNQGFVVVNSIEDEIVVLGTQAIDGKGGAASFAVAEGFRVAACARRRGVGHAASDVGFESGELREIAAVEGQLGDLTALHDDTNGGIARVDDRGACLHGDGLRDLTD